MNRDWAQKDFYQILGVSKTAAPEEIKRAYRKLARRYHPDANPGDTGKAEQFKGISEAYSVLSDSERRNEYDEVRRLVGSGAYSRFPGGGHGAPFGGQVNLEDLLGGFGDLFGGGRPTAARKGADLNADLRLTFEEAMSGAVKSVDVRGQALCSDCGGSGSRAGSPPDPRPGIGPDDPRSLPGLPGKRRPPSNPQRPGQDPPRHP